MFGLKILQLNCPSHNWDNHEFRSIFNQMIELRLSGYRKYHFQNALPLDTVDFIADHLFICRETDKGLEILSCVKSISKAVADMHRVGFTPEMILKKETKKEAYLEAYNAIINAAHSENKDVAYYSSWTMKHHSLLPEEKVLLKEIFTAMTINYHTEKNIKYLFGFGVPKFKTDAYFETWGYERVRFQGKPLENIPASLLEGIDSVFMALEHFTPYAKAIGEKYADLWKNRIVLGEDMLISTPLEKAS